MEITEHSLWRRKHLRSLHLSLAIRFQKNRRPNRFCQHGSSMALTMGSTTAVNAGRYIYHLGSFRDLNLVHSSTRAPSEKALSTFSKFNRPATSSVSGHLLKNKLIAEEISGGHTFTKHVIKQGEFPEFSQHQFQRHIQNIVNNPTEMKFLTRGRIAYWDQKTGTVVIRNPGQGDGGTAFKATGGYDYFSKGLK